MEAYISNKKLQVYPIPWSLHWGYYGLYYQLNPSVRSYQRNTDHRQPCIITEQCPTLFNHERETGEVSVMEEEMESSWDKHLRAGDPGWNPEPETGTLLEKLWIHAQGLSLQYCRNVKFLIFLVAQWFLKIINKRKQGEWGQEISAPTMSYKSKSFHKFLRLINVKESFTIFSTPTSG